MLIEPTRYRQRPPEVDALLVLDDTTDAALAWLRSWNRDAYVTTDGLRVVDQGPDGAPAFDVPFGTYLIRDIRTGGWAPVPSSTLEAEYVSAREAARRERGYM